MDTCWIHKDWIYPDNYREGFLDIGPDSYRDGFFLRIGLFVFTGCLRTQSCIGILFAYKRMHLMSEMPCWSMFQSHKNTKDNYKNVIDQPQTKRKSYNENHTPDKLFSV